MRTIWKYNLSRTDLQKIQMPIDAELLYVDNQGGPTLWALVDTDNPSVERLICIVGTGHPIPGPEISGRFAYAYVGSVLDGPFVWHIFDGGQALSENDKDNHYISEDEEDK